MTRKTVIVDIDGTVADLSHRLHFIKPHPMGSDGDLRKDWDSFFAACVDDEPIHEMVDLVSLLAAKYDIVFVTGRPERIRSETYEWLMKHIFHDQDHIENVQLEMRADRDHRPDDRVKKEIYLDYLRDTEIAFVLEDRARVVKMWRDLGLRVLQVTEGEF